MADEPSTACPLRGPAFWLGWVAAAGVAVALYALNLAFGELNQDEGWYLYAGRLVAEGQLPYIDFAHTQLPVMPFTYALAWPLVAKWGVAGGRCFTAMLGLAGALLAAVAAARMASPDRRRLAALLAFVLVAINAYHSYYTTVVKTYALCGMWVAGAFALVTVERGRIGRVATYLAGVALALATGTRLTAGVFVPVVVAGLWCVRERRPGDWVRLGIGAAATGLVLVVPFLWLAPQNFLFCVLEYHAGRRTDNLVTWLVYRAGFMSRWVQAYFVMAAAMVAAAVAWWMERAGHGPRPVDHGVWLRRTAWAGVAGVTLVHLTASVPYEDYQVLLVPVAAMALAAGIGGVLRTDVAVRWAAVVVVLVSIGAAFASPINQSWFVSGRDRIWWRLRAKPHLTVLREAAAQVKALARGDDLLLTQDAYLAVEAGMRLPRGLELGPFSYYPGMDTATARQRHVLNGELMERLLQDCPARVAALSGYGLAIASPAVAELPEDARLRLRALLARHYTPASVIRPFGQGDTPLELWTRTP